MVNAVYIGSEDDGRKILQPLLSVKALQSNVTMIPYNRLFLENRFGVDPLGCISGIPQASYGMNPYLYGFATYQKTLAAYIDFYAATNLTTSYMVTEIFPTRVSLKTPDQATAYPYRATMAYLQVLATAMCTYVYWQLILLKIHELKWLHDKCTDICHREVYERDT